VAPWPPPRLIPTRANGQPAYGCYIPEVEAPVASPAGLLVLTLEQDRIRAITRFLDTALHQRFGLPETLPRRPGDA